MFLFKWAPEVLRLVESKVEISIRYNKKNAGLGTKRYTPFQILPEARSMNSGR